MIEKINPSENNIEIEKTEFFAKHPLPEKFKRYASKAWKLHRLTSVFYNDPEKYKELYDFSQMIEEKKPNPEQYYLFQMISGGSYEITTEFDFEGEYSIEKFLKTHSKHE
jgi:hypothetical protein